VESNISNAVAHSYVCFLMEEGRTPCVLIATPPQGQSAKLRAMKVAKMERRSGVGEVDIKGTASQPCYETDNQSPSGGAYL
jgi:hypothetical protein